MVVNITEEISLELLEKFDFITDSMGEWKRFFEDKMYGEDVRILYIGLFCMSPQFDNFFKAKKPKYTEKGRDSFQRGIFVPAEDKALEYELRLDYKSYLSVDNIKSMLANDILNSLSIMQSVKKIKDFDLVTFRSDLERFLRLIGWLNNE